MAGRPRTTAKRLAELEEAAFQLNLERRYISFERDANADEIVRDLIVNIA